MRGIGYALLVSHCLSCEVAKAQQDIHCHRVGSHGLITVWVSLAPALLLHMLPPVKVLLPDPHGQLILLTLHAIKSHGF